MEESILKHATVTVPVQIVSCVTEGTRYQIDSGGLREDKSIAVNPIGVLRVEFHELVEKDVSNRCHAPRAV